MHFSYTLLSDSAGGLAAFVSFLCVCVCAI